ncbi:hypothetical protein EGY07_02870 [Chryseobacterium indologenes]|uniref:Magnesium citrate secondary transporter n=2 Tax=Chryseobacterium indologenes TaxID=253 RepID=A0AAD1DVI0_CHRID|nr:MULTISPECIES: hypothetical protein [Chryseobacterium]AYZ34578.1 hypothetical protein EGY07_02870 [Chryseobacterium indologenes]AZB18209.1 hypothetical protein EG352_10675 [Chryseobacterium indologenes]MBF6643151.1 hypothetical protein [Chryseobacterium indologenes]MEB4759014.1 hypothetical protein [Chryseobacterium indologenes]QQQ72958.1 hypothetical protein JHW31_09600 [Chryseobacterium indologenes]
MKGKISYWFCLGLILWAVIIGLRKNSIYLPVINEYFTDLITVPMYCYLIEMIMNFLGYTWKPDVKFVLTSAIYLSFLFEVLCPRLSNVFTADFFDVMAYFSGGILYYLFRIKSFRRFKKEEK